MTVRTAVPWIAGLPAAALLIAFSPTAQATVPVELVVVTAITADGYASEDWLTILRSRLPPPQYDSVAPLQKAMTPDENAWAALIRSRVPAWGAMAVPLAALYSPAAPPTRVRIVLGNRGMEDAFTADPQTIGFDLAILVALYGGAQESTNADRIDRFFRHEFTHILQKTWLASHRWTDASPLARALFDIWAEGLANYYSLSDQWVGPDHRLTERASSALLALEPSFASRLRDLACADSAVAPALLAGLSSGPFDQKWGALPAALWLASEHDSADGAQRRLIVAGPAGVWDLAERHVTEPLRASLRDARAAGVLCARQ